MLRKILSLVFFLPTTLLADTQTSPDGQMEFRIYEQNGRPTYELFYQGRQIIKPSALGLKLNNWPSLADGFALKGTKTSTFDETWTPVWGEVSTIRNNYNEIEATFHQAETKRDIIIRARVYNEGVGFRYELPRQEKLDNVIIGDELTQFAMTADHTAYWIPGDYDTSEYEYTISRLSEIEGLFDEAVTANATQRQFSKTGVQTSLLMKTDDGLYINLHEAALLDYSAMHLNLDPKTLTFTSWLTPDSRGRKAYVRCPAVTPWRTIMVTPTATAMLDSKLILNLNEPCKIEDTSWIKPVKYMGVWWEMMTGAATWNYAPYMAVRIGETDFSKLPKSGRHASNNENVKRYIDFASKHGFDQLLVEGWNEGWEDNWQKDLNYSFTRSYPDFDVPMLQKYAYDRGMKLMMHHETSASVPNYERQLDAAYRFASENGYDAIKSGYVGDIFPNGGHHFDQWMINHYHYAVVEAAKHRLMVNAHEAVRPTGLCRTWPNMIGNESARGMEFQASEGINPRHVTILPFTRLQGGPMDYTPGILEMDISSWYADNKAKVKATVCNQLALYVTLYSPLQMAADTPDNYEKYLDAFQFIKDVAVDWQDSRYLEAEPGKYITVARKAKNSDSWFMGSVSGDGEHTSKIRLSFLDPNRKYVARIYQDGKDASWQHNPQSYTIEEKVVTSKTMLTLRAVESGGWAVSLIPQ